ncbi:phage tail sheath family protein [Paracoccus caeni]|uniref:Phage tail sheath family protein n=1 Tax=Paracoccus caeni TaxID=657651 RepID=A0A934VYY9_9RHOB|nr:phage tail sheath subtilisin-like domain-containing protein [Paracoccus caeni]MBK4216497.1 phage tail sheath family protein [Paracoccus caeni]
MAMTYQIPGVYARPRPRAEGFPRVRTDVTGFVGIAGPRHLGEAVAVNDWQGYVAAYRTDGLGNPVPPPPGAVLDKAVRDYFANGGRRLWIVNVAASVDALPAAQLLNRMLGLDNLAGHHGLELLLRQSEVMLVALPDLDAEIVVEDDRAEPLPPRGNPCFGPCRTIRSDGANGHGAASAHSFGRAIPADDMLWAQQYLLTRLERERWRWFALLAPPSGYTLARAMDWRTRLTQAMGGSDLGALYWPWLLVQDSPGAPVELRSPIGAVAGIFAATDIAEGPHVAPANRPVSGVVGLETPIGDRENARAYEAGINLLRSFPGQGIRVWGARTLLWQGPLDAADPLSFVNARRCLSAIARSAEVVGQPMVFEPNTALLRIKFHQLMVDYLRRVFATGALKGAQPEDAFFVKVETVESTAEGHLECTIGVALAQPAEFIEFRIGREGGVIERAEAV